MGSITRFARGSFQVVTAELAVVRTEYERAVPKHEQFECCSPITDGGQVDAIECGCAAVCAEEGEEGESEGAVVLRCKGDSDLIDETSMGTR